MTIRTGVFHLHPRLPTLPPAVPRRRAGATAPDAGSRRMPCPGCTTCSATWSRSSLRSISKAAWAGATCSAAVTAAALGGLGVRSRAAEAAAPIRPRPLPPAGPVPAAILAQMQADPGAPPSQQTTDNVVDPGDPRIIAGVVSFAGAAGDLLGYLAQPADGAVHPGIGVVHENWGLIEPNM